MRISVRGKAPCDPAPVRAAIRAAIAVGGTGEPTPGAVLTVAFVDDDAMRVLNARHRHKDRTTDVLSFGQALPRRAKGAAAIAALARDVDGVLDFGDVVISVPQAERQARRRGHPLGAEVAFLAAHGTLHLLGYDDQTWAGYREMVRLGTAAIERAGVGRGRPRAPRR